MLSNDLVEKSLDLGMSAALRDLRLLPLGDSITDGGLKERSYRYHLYQMFVQDGQRVGVQPSTMVEVPARRVVLRIRKIEAACHEMDFGGAAPTAHHP